MWLPRTGRLDASGVDQATVDRETAILRDKNAGKPDNVMQKIIESGLKSYFKEVTSWSSPSCTIRSKTVTQVLKEAESKAGKPVTLKAFVRYALGEGIEKEEAPTLRRKSPPRPRLNGPTNRTQERALSGAVFMRGFEKRGLMMATFRRILVKLSGEALMAPMGIGSILRSCPPWQRTGTGHPRRFRDRRRHRRRQHHPWCPHERGRLDRPSHRRFHGHARHGDELARPSKPP